MLFRMNFLEYTTVHVVENFEVTILVTKNPPLTEGIIEMCKTLKDVQNCAEMGDFKILRYDLVNQVAVGR